MFNFERGIMGNNQSQDVGQQPKRPDQQGQGTPSPQQPNDRPTPQSGQDKGKDQGQNRPGQMGDKGSSGAN
jgi:hypothetical protein